MNFKDTITFFYAIEKLIWDKKVEPNKYLATLSILFVALLGAWYNIETLLGWQIGDPIFHVKNMIMLVVYLWIMNITESVIACKDITTAVLRSLLFLPNFGFAYLIGVTLGTAAIVIICIILFIILCYMVIDLFEDSQNTSSGREWKGI